MHPSSSRPDLNWTPYPVHLPPPPSAYLHVIVVEATSARHPKPSASRTALYTVAVLPRAPLEVGRYVHIHLLCSTVPGDVVPANMDRAVAVPLSVAGRLAGVRMHHSRPGQGQPQGGGEEIEFVLKNEVAGAQAGVGRAFVRVRYVPGVSARVSLAGALEERLQRLVASNARREEENLSTRRRYMQQDPIRTTAGDSRSKPRIAYPVESGPTAFYDTPDWTLSTNLAF